MKFKKKICLSSCNTRIVFSLSITLGLCISIFKKTILISLYKLSNKNNCNKYRSNSLTLSIAKTFEKYIKDRVVHFFNQKKFFSINKYGFIKDKFTTDALVDVTDHIC